ncbi:hypothetical protein [Sphingobium sp. 15-1]|nr:hypothetical protein [Sphingobium sp. 15-1]
MPKLVTPSTIPFARTMALVPLKILDETVARIDNGSLVGMIYDPKAVAQAPEAT